MKTLFKKIFVLCISLLTLLEIGCISIKDFGTGGKVFGTAATGAAIIGTVYIKGTNQLVSYSTIKSDGSYSVDVRALTPPFIIYAEGTSNGKSVRLYSTVDLPGSNVNVTPATNMILAIALGKNPESWYSPEKMKNQDLSIEAPPTKINLDSAKEQVRAILAAVLTALGLPADFDIMNGSFDVGGQFDQVLDNVVMGVSTNTTGNAQVTVSAATGTVYYYDDLSTPSIVEDDTNLGNIGNVAISVTQDIDAITTLCDAWGQSIMGTDIQKEIFLNANYADDYLNSGMDKATAIYDEITYNRNPAGITSVAITDVVIVGPVVDTDFTGGGTLTTTENRTIDGKTFAADTYTFNNGTMDSLKNSNVKAVKILVTVSAVVNGQTQVFTDPYYVVQPDGVGTWYFWGDRKLSESEFRTMNRRMIYASYNGTTQLYEKKDLKISGYSLWYNDPGNSSLYFGYGNEINAILVTGDGMLNSYTNDGKKGILLVKLDPMDSQFRPVNNTVTDDKTGEYCTTVNDLDASQITSAELTVTAMHYDAVNKSFTPVYTWKANTGGVLPKAPEQLTNAMFPAFTNLTSTDMKDYNSNFGTNNFPNFSNTFTAWNLGLAWTPPTSQGEVVFWALSCWYSGAGMSEGWQPNGSEELIRNDGSSTPVTSFTFSKPAAETNGVIGLKEIGFQLTYGENAKNGAEYTTEYRISTGESASVNGTITVPQSLMGKPYFIAVDTDNDPSNGWSNSYFATVPSLIVMNNNQFNYNISNVAAGTYNVYCAVYDIYSSIPIPFVTAPAGYYWGYIPNVTFGASGIQNVQIPVVCQGASVAGMVTQSTLLNRPYYIVIDNDLDIFNGFIASTNGYTDNTGIIPNFQIPNVPAGMYYVYCVIYSVNIVPGNPLPVPMIGDAIGYYGATPPGLPTGTNVPVPQDFSTVNNINIVTAVKNL